MLQRRLHRPERLVCRRLGQPFMRQRNMCRRIRRCTARGNPGPTCPFVTVRPSRDGAGYGADRGELECGLPNMMARVRTLAVHRNRLIPLPLSNCYSDGVGPCAFAQDTKLPLAPTPSPRPRRTVTSVHGHEGPRKSVSKRWTQWGVERCQ